MQFQVPIYVQKIKSGYAAKPVFFPQISQTDNDLNRLNTKLNRDLVQHLEKLAKANRHDELAQWAFCPALTHQRVSLTLELRRRAAQVSFLLVSFRHFNQRIAFTPSIPGLWFEYERNENLEERAREVIQAHWRQVERDAEDDNDVLPEAEALSGQAWVQWNAVNVQVPVMRPKVESSLMMFFGSAAGVADGATELRRVGRCLDWLYPNELQRAFLRDAEVSELLRLLDDPDNRPVLIVGPRLVGKTTLIQECVYRRVEARGGKNSPRQQTWLISPQRLISGMSYVGQWESRLLGIFKYAQRRQLVLYFDDLIGLFLAGRTANSNLNVAQVMKPYLEDRLIRVLAEITPEGLRVLREQDRNFADQFQILPLREGSDAENLKVLFSVQRQLEAKHNCDFDLGVLPIVMELQRRYERDAAFPGKAATVLTRLAVRHSISQRYQDSLLERRLNPLADRPRIETEHVYDDFEDRTGLSLVLLDSSLRLQRPFILQELQKLVIGQQLAVEALADVVSIAKARLNDPDRPLAAFLFLGPTGVGKTESAKALARTLYGHQDRLLRFDLNEFNQPGSAARLVGTLDQPEGLLTSAIRRQPFAVILLDEIEKADPDVFDVLLQVLGEGRLTDALGRTADFTNAIIILTSNLGVREAEGGVGFIPMQDTANTFTRAAERFFRPEFFNRLDRVIPFRKLTRSEMGLIARQLVDKVLQREGFAQRKCVLSVSESALERVIETGYDPALGARAMKRAVESQLARPAANQLAVIPQNPLTIVSIDATEHGLTVHVQAPSFPEQQKLQPRGTVAERLASYQDLFEDYHARHHELRPRGALTGKPTPEHERYFILNEMLEEIRKKLDRLQEHNEQQRLAKLVVGSSQALGRRPRYKQISEPKDYSPDGGSALKVLLSAENMQTAIDELLQELSPVDEDQELYDLDRRLALVRLVFSVEPDDRPVYLWIRGYPEGGEVTPYPMFFMQLYLIHWEHELGIELRHIPESSLLKSERLLELKGHHARALANLEAGTHLILPRHGGIVPFRVEVLDHLPTAADRRPHYGPILRVYPDDKPIIDFRSNLVAPQPIIGEQFRAMTLAALP